MYLDNFDIKAGTGKPKYKILFMYWLNFLFNFCNRLFTWEGLPFPQKELETRLILQGKVGVVKNGNELLAVPVNLFGITDYIDEFTDFNWTTPKRNGTATINVDGVLIDNDTLRNPLIILIQRYANLLAHAEISFINALVIGRANKSYVASTDKVAESVRRFTNKLYDGTLEPIVDKTFQAVQVLENDSTSIAQAPQLFDTLQNILYMFYEDIGVKKNREKKERQITDEITADSGLLKLNISDMLIARQRACEDLKKVFGIDVKVICNVDIDADGVPEGGTNET